MTELPPIGLVTVDSSVEDRARRAVIRRYEDRRLSAVDAVWALEALGLTPADGNPQVNAPSSPAGNKDHEPPKENCK